MTIDEIKTGLVLDHIQAGKAMLLYNYLGLDKLGCSVAVLQNVKSSKCGKKDIIKIDDEIDLDLDALGYIDPGITINVIKDGIRIEKKSLSLPSRIKNVIKCKNPRCITSAEQEIDHVFNLLNAQTGEYCCEYCESISAKKNLF